MMSIATIAWLRYFPWQSWHEIAIIMPLWVWNTMFMPWYNMIIMFDHGRQRLITTSETLLPAVVKTMIFLWNISEKFTFSDSGQTISENQLGNVEQAAGSKISEFFIVAAFSSFYPVHGVLVFLPRSWIILNFFPRSWKILQNLASLAKNNCQDFGKKCQKSNKFLGKKTKTPSTG